MGTRNDDISLKLAKAVKAGFLPDVRDDEVDILQKEAKNLFGGDITIGPDFPACIGILYAGIGARNSRSVVMAAVGSSTIQGSGASSGKGVMPVFFANMQAAYPLDSGIVQPVGVSLATALATPPSLPGLQYFNAAVGGTQSSNYLTETTLPQVASLQPSVIFHCVGSNDWAADVPITTYEANLKSKLDALDAGITVKPLHILIHAFQRKDASVATFLHPWYEYGSTLKRIAQERPDNVLFVDLSEPYEKAGILGTDPWGIMSGDNIHMTNTGHAIMADLLRKALSLSTATAVPVQNPSPWRVTSDTFSTDSADAKDRSMDLLLGGAAKTWISGDALPSGFKTASGTLQLDTANHVTRFIGVAIPAVDAQISATFTAIPVGSGFLLDLYRVSSAGGGSPDAYRINITAGGGDVVLQKRVSTVTTNLFTLLGNGTGNVGYRFTIRYYRGLLSLLRDGAVLFSIADSSIPQGGWAGIARSSSVTTNGGGLDNFAIDLLS